MNDKPRVLVVDDERPIRRFLNASLGGEYQVMEASTGQEALLLCGSAHPDIILLDLGLPDLDGIEVTRRLREWTQIPVIIITVREQEEAKIAALDAGADDYLIKPFGIGELMARMRVALRRDLHIEQDPIYRVEGLLVDLARRHVTINGNPVALTPTEYDILRILVQHAGKVLTHQQLARTVWNSDRPCDSHLLRVNISNLRRKLETNPSQPHYILTEAGVGYRLKAVEAVFESQLVPSARSIH